MVRSKKVFLINKVAAAVALCFFTVHGMADANIEDSSWYMLPSLGVMHSDSDLDAENNSLAYALRIGKRLDTNWDVQVGLSGAQADEDDARFVGGKYRQTLFGVDALYFLSREKLKPFLLAGFGAAHNRVSYSNPNGFDESNTSLMANVGAGVQYQLSDRIGLQADVRHVWSRADGVGVFGPAATKGDETVGNTYLNVGVIINFGGQTRQIAQAPVEQAVQPAPAAEPVRVAPSQPVEEQHPVVAGPKEEQVIDRVSLQAEALFDFDHDQLKPEGRKILDEEVAAKMKAHPEIEIVLITGHTDRLGTAAYNLKLSQRRADEVKQYLVQSGIEENRLHAVGKGETMPVVECGGGLRHKTLVECLKPNRRVVVEIESRRR